MSKANYEFDEDFNKLLELGSRHELSDYRNRIIDELKDRGELGAETGSVLERLDSVISRRFAIGMILASIAVIVFLVGYVAKLYHQGSYGLEMALVCIAIIAIVVFDILQTGSLLRIYKDTSQRKDAERHEGTNQHIGTRSCKDSIDVLKRKKSILDEKLGL